MEQKSSMNIYGIAKRAGVSIATVSRVLNGSDKVSGKTREKVLAVMREESFTPNVFARGLGLGTMRMAGILCTDVSDLYYATAVAALERSLRVAGLGSLLCCTGNELAAKKEAIDLLLAKNVDAILLVGSAFKEQYDNSHIMSAAKHVPVIVINGIVECEGVYCVLCDEAGAMRENVRQLYQSGCRRMLYIYDAETYSGTQKLAGLRRGLESAGIPEDGRLIIKTGKTIGHARDAVNGILKSGVQIDAVLASEDILAIGACKALAGSNRDMPVIGFNNSILAECATPPLTSVDNMVEALCTTAAGMLQDLLDSKLPPSKVTVAARLVERETFRAGNYK